MDTFDKLMLIYSRIRAENDEPQEQPAATGAVIEVASAAMNLVLPPTLARLYAWHNGIFHLNAFLHFLPLREAVQNHRSNAEARQAGWLPSASTNWYSVLDLNGDVQFCVDVINGELWALDLEDGLFRKLASHYEAYVDALVAAFERGLANYDDQSGAFQIDFSDWTVLCREHGLEEPW